MGKHKPRRRVAPLRTLTQPVTFSVSLSDITAAATAKALPLLRTAFSHTATGIDETADGVNFWHTLKLDDKRTLAGASPAFGTPLHAPHQDDVVLPLVPGALSLAASGGCVLRLVVGKDFVVSVDAVEAPDTPPPPPAAPSFALWHVSMVNDRPRNDAYRAAIRHAVQQVAAATGRAPEVLDVGAGAGLLSVMAAQAGAAAVTAVEASEPVVPRLRATVADNNLEDVITVMAVHSTAVTVQDEEVRCRGVRQSRRC